MRPISIEFQAFGPYEGMEIVDFDKLSKHGLFLIDGKTGSGKTMILDAITFALYGKSSGANRDDLEQLRCSHCDPGSDTYVKFTFEEKGVIYIFERRLEKKVKNLSKKCSARKINEAGIEEPLFQNCKEGEMTKKAEKLIGLSYEQFRQVIILPQGKFEQLLTSKSEDKEKVLATIFDADKWAKIATRFYDKANAIKEETDKIKSGREESLKEEGCSSIDELGIKISDLEKYINEEESAFLAAGYQNRKKELQEKKILANDFDLLNKYKSTLNDLNGQKKAIDDNQNTLNLAEEAEKLRNPLEKLNDARTEADNRNTSYKKAQEAFDNSTKALSSVQEEEKLIHAEESEYDSNKNLLTAYELKKPSYKAIEELRLKATTAENLKAKVQKELDELQEATDKCEERTNKAFDDSEKADQQYSDIRASYMAGIKGHLAKELVDGEICPVCGSTHHPSPASVPAGCADMEEVEKAEDESEAKKAIWKKASASLEESRKKLADKKTEASNATIEYEKARSNVENAEKDIIEGISTIKDLENEEQRLKKKNSDYEKRKEAIIKRLEDSRNSVAAAEKALNLANEEAAKAKENLKATANELNKMLTGSPFATSEEAKSAMMDMPGRNALRDSIKGYYDKVEEYQKLHDELSSKLDGESAPDSKAIDDELDSIDAAEKEYNEQQGGRKNQLDRLKNKHKDLSEQSKAYEEAIGKAESILTFAKALRGDTGVGLQRYVLGIMFSSVIRSANEMLRNVEGGRYTLFTTKEKVAGAYKRGLDLKVMDNCGGSKDGRSVSTLSGGEKFLASLALSIGLAGIAKTGGVDIEGIFIDEGFGTLDEDSIADALSILSGVQKANGMVGIISHVELLRENIPNQIHVLVDDKKASTIK